MTDNDFRPPIPKRCPFNLEAPFPVDVNGTGDNNVEPHYYGKFNGFNIIIENRNDMIALYTKGYFGKGSLSQGYPSFEKRRIKRLTEQLNSNESDESVKTKTSTEPYSVVEHLHLMVEESFFLAYVLECLTVNYENKILNTNDMWKLFQNVEPYFVERYVTYHHFRAKGWVVKPGLKYGGDYLLYKKGPPFYHASFVAIILSNFNENMKTKQCDDFLAINRAIEAARKELLICQVILPRNIEHDLNLLEECQLSEFLFKRWVPTERKDSIKEDFCD